MIARLSGKIVGRNLDSVILDVNGLGYRVFVLEKEASNLLDDIILFTHLYIREDQMSLYGFSNENELSLFEMLISVSGIGPKAALGILSVGDVEMLKKAIAEGRSDILKSVSGVGKKTADRAILELQGKVSFGDNTSLPSRMSKEDDNAVSALVHLGYKKQEAQRAIEEVKEKTEGMIVEDKIKEALKYLGS